MRKGKVVRGQDLRDIIRREVEEQTYGLWNSIEELRGVQDQSRSEIRWEEATTQGPKIPGSWEELERKVVEAAEEGYALSKKGVRPCQEGKGKGRSGRTLPEAHRGGQICRHGGKREKP